MPETDKSAITRATAARLSALPGFYSGVPGIFCGMLAVTAILIPDRYPLCLRLVQ